MRPLAIEAQVLRDMRPEEAIRAAGRAGFAMAGVWIDPASWSDADTVAVRNAFGDSGVKPLDAEVIRIEGSLGKDQLKLIDVAGSIGIPHVIVISLTSDASATIAALSRLAEQADCAGTGLVLEFAPFSAVATAAEAVEIVSRVERPVGILPDPLHLVRSGGGPADLAAISPDRIHFAQICDAAEPPAPRTPEALLHEARFERLNLGDGHLPLDDYLASLPAHVPLSNEVRSAKVEQEYPDPFERARFLAARMRHFLAARDQPGESS